jgi:hypothetical protein
MVQRGWLTKHKTKRNGMTWVYHFYRDKPETGKRVENTATIGSVLHFPRRRTLGRKWSAGTSNPILFRIE